MKIDWKTCFRVGVTALIFYLCISFSFLASKRKRNAPKEKEKTLIFYALRAFRPNNYVFQLHSN